MSTAKITLLCSVRGCGEPLAPSGRALACPRGHGFDLARSGYLNLLQPQDRRSRAPGDSRDAALARRRLFAAGHLAPLLTALVETVADLALLPRPAILDVGCGEGTILATLGRGLPGAELHGVDISAPAIDLAARAYPQATWIVANADRALPYGDGGFDLALSITSRQRPRELRRLLAPGGALLVAVPGADDLRELREILASPAPDPERRARRLLARWEKTAATFAPELALAAHLGVRWTVALDAGGIEDLLASTYRGARHAERRRLAGVERLAVTMSRDLLTLRPA